MIRDTLKHISIILNKEERTGLKLYFFLFLILSILEAVSVGLIPAFFTILIDKNLLLSKFEFSPDFYLFLKNILNKNNIILQFTFLILIFFVIKAVYTMIFYIYEAKLFNKFKIRLSSSLFKIYLNKNYLFHSKNNPLILGRNMSSEINTTAYYIRSFILIIKEFIQIFLIGLILIFGNLKISVSIFVILALAALVYLRMFSGKLSEKAKISFFERGEKSKIINQILNAIIEVKLYSKSEFFIKKFTNSIKREFQSKVYMDIISKLPKISIELLIVIIVCLSIMLAMSFNFHLDVIIPTIALYFFAAIRVYPSINNILLNRLSLVRDRVSLTKISNEFQNSEKDIEPKDLAQENFIFENVIQLKNMSFVYNDRESIFENINLEINKSDTVGIVGETGSGKSTLMKIIMGLVDPSKGSISIDGKNISKIRRSWQKQIGYVPQNFYLFDDTIYENIIFGEDSEKVNVQKVNEVIKDSFLEKFINNLPNKVDTLIGPNAKQISGGQAQRLAIARALYQETNFLIFDEATSSVDVKTENEIIQNIYSLKNKKTLVIITHKESLLRGCNKIFRIKDKQLIKVK